MDGLLRTREKLLDGSSGGFFMEMLKAMAKPVYNWVIGTDNDHVMEKCKIIWMLFQINKQRMHTQF